MSDDPVDPGPGARLPATDRPLMKIGDADVDFDPQRFDEKTFSEPPSYGDLVVVSQGLILAIRRLTAAMVAGGMINDKTEDYMADILQDTAKWLRDHTYKEG